MKAFHSGLLQGFLHRCQMGAKSPEGKWDACPLWSSRAVFKSLIPLLLQTYPKPKRCVCSRWLSTPGAEAVSCCERMGTALLLQSVSLSSSPGSKIGSDFAEQVVFRKWGAGGGVPSSRWGILCTFCYSAALGHVAARRGRFLGTRRLLRNQILGGLA